MLGDVELLVVVLLLVGLVLGVAWLCLTVSAFFKPRGTGRDFARLCACPLIVVVAVGLALFDLGFQARFELSQASLERVARAAPPTASGQEGCRGPGNDYRPVRAGLFEIRCAERHEDGDVTLYMRAFGFPNLQGFTWNRDGILSESRRLNDHWELWSSGHDENW